MIITMILFELGDDLLRPKLVASTDATFIQIKYTLQYKLFWKRVMRDYNKLDGQIKCEMNINWTWNKNRKRNKKKLIKENWGRKAHTRKEYIGLKL